MRRRSGKIKIKHRVDRRRGGWKEVGEESEEGSKELVASRVEEGNIKSEKGDRKKSRLAFRNLRIISSQLSQSLSIATFRSDCRGFKRSPFSSQANFLKLNSSLALSSLSFLVSTVHRMALPEHPVHSTGPHCQFTSL